jgi:hypothetical protein
MNARVRNPWGGRGLPAFGGAEGDQGSVRAAAATNCRPPLGIASFLVLILLSGCTTASDPTRMDLASAGKVASELTVPESLKPYYQRLYWEGESNATLNRMRLVSAAIQEDEWTVAENELTQVIQAIEALGPADERSRKALSKFQEEQIKKFKGERYERAMAYFLRGVLYLRTEEWDNARACFKSVQIQDVAKPDAGYEGTWASAHWLEGWCNMKLNEASVANECWTRAQRLNGSFPRVSQKENVLCMALLGRGPAKIPKGKYGQELTYRGYPPENSGVRIYRAGDFKVFWKAEDLFLQASTQGRRHMDDVNLAKADTRGVTDAAGDLAMIGGAGTAIGGAVNDDTTVAAIGLGVVAAGVATKGIASTIKPMTDARTWDLLPAEIHLLPLEVKENEKLEFELLDEKGRVLEKRDVSLTKVSPNLVLLIER